MENKECNSFYDTDTTSTNNTTTVLPTNQAGKKTEETQTAIPTVSKKRSTLWIWAASYFAAVIFSPEENPNYRDISNTNVTP
ncbi:hypothetical protein [Flavobacterium mesophilum]|uniref:hypothetical protein n=1 Tax=Flavobacterium mesophilum TaxID=3143495 RepID=UPI0031D8E980